MYLHLGQDVLVRTRDVVGIFDLDTSTVGGDTRDLLARDEKSGRVVNVSGGLPKSFIIAGGRGTQVFISPLNPSVLKKRIENKK